MNIITALKNGYKIELEGKVMQMQGGRVFDQTGFMYTKYLNLYCNNKYDFKIIKK